jgi:hypothetical protein
MSPNRIPEKNKGDDENRGDDMNFDGDALINVIADPAIDVDDRNPADNEDEEEEL